METNSIILTRFGLILYCLTNGAVFSSFAKHLYFGCVIFETEKDATSHSSELPDNQNLQAGQDCGQATAHSDSQRSIMAQDATRTPASSDSMVTTDH